MSEWWQNVKLYQPQHFFQEIAEKYGEVDVIRKTYIKGSGYSAEKISESIYKNGDVRFTMKLRRHGYQVSKQCPEGSITRFYHDLKEARELL